jgi:hypothetical protein
LEIASPGELPFGLTPEQLKKPHSSRPWNPLMANVFYRRGIIETWGRGTLKIMDLLDKAGLPAPEFFNQAGSFVVVFRIPKEKWLTPQNTPPMSPRMIPRKSPRMMPRKSNSFSRSVSSRYPGKKCKIG